MDVKQIGSQVAEGVASGVESLRSSLDDLELPTIDIGNEPRERPSFSPIALLGVVVVAVAAIAAIAAGAWLMDPNRGARRRAAIRRRIDTTGVRIRREADSAAGEAHEMVAVAVEGDGTESQGQLGDKMQAAATEWTDAAQDGIESASDSVKKAAGKTRDKVEAATAEAAGE